MTFTTDKTKIDKHIKKACIVYFYTTYCPVCRQLSKVFEEVSELREDIAFYKANLDEDISLAERYEITHVPTLIIFGGGEPILGHIGLMNEEKLAEFIEKVFPLATGPPAR
jgi:thioredoxin 1